MKIRTKLAVNLIGSGLLLCGFAASAALPSAWQHTQSFDVATPGLVKISVPVETLDAARPALEDLRLCDDRGNELPWLVERPVPAGKTVQPAKSFQISLQPGATVMTLETGLTQPLAAVMLESPAQNFIKAVRVESSTDGQSWRTLAQGQPIFRQPNGAGNLKITFPVTATKKLRLVVDDQRSSPIPFTSARLQTANPEAAPTETQAAVIAERDENPGETRLVLNLGAANLDVASVQIETAATLFTRTVTVAVPQVTEAGGIEQEIGRGAIYRVALDGQPATSHLSVPLERHVDARELILRIRNEDSPPLPITGAQIERRPVYLVFLAPTAGTYHLLTGNKFCAAPHYDLAALASNLKNTVATPVNISPVAANPDFRAPEALAGLNINGATLDVSPWKYRRPIKLTGTGVQQVELDLTTLSHANGSFSDLRVMSGSNQVPFMVQRTSISRELVPAVTVTNDAKNPQISRWLIKLPYPHLPLTRLTCTAATPLFQRTMTLSEKYSDARGDSFFRQLANATWTQTPDNATREFSLTLNSVAESDTLILETENGDNPPIKLDNFNLFYPATRILFKTGENRPLYLYYGNPQAAAPNYDLGLMGSELLTADKATATLGTEDQLRKTSWAEGQVPGRGGIIFWGILAVVVIGLLTIISRLLPKTSAS